METFETSSSRQDERRRRPSITAGIPAYNQEKSIERIVQDMPRYVERVIAIDIFNRTGLFTNRAGPFSIGPVVICVLLIVVSAIVDVLARLSRMVPDLGSELYG